MIANKDGDDVPFILNSAQSQLDTNLTGRDIIPKARQEGISSYYLGRALAKCLGKRNTKAVIISHEEKATQRMLQKIHYFIEHIRGPKPIIKNMSQNAITFPKTDSMIYIGTAGAKKFGRGDTINFLHCSEVAYWPDPKGLLSGLFQAVPKSGEIGLESTGNGKGNYYHRACMRAAIGESRYRLHFFDWQSFPEYTDELSPSEEQFILSNLKPDWDELMLMERFSLTPGQISWRRGKIEELDYDISEFQQEYPMTLDECFQATGRSIFHNVDVRQDAKWERVDSNTYHLEGHPYPSYKYAVGVDVGGGIGGRSSNKNAKSKGDGDRSVIQVVCLDTMHQVLEYANNSIAPDVLSAKIAKVGKHFNNAFITVENNNHGIVTISELLKLYPNYLIYKRPRGKSGLRDEVDKITDYGFRTSVKSKPYAIGELRKLIAHELVIYSSFLKDEMDSFVENDNGQMEAESGCFDDRVMALAMCIVGIEKALLYTGNQIYVQPDVKDDPFTLESIISEMHSRQLKFPISEQAATAEDCLYEDFNFIG